MVNTKDNVPAARGKRGPGMFFLLAVSALMVLGGSWTLARQDAAAAPVERALTLAEAVRLALTNNPEVVNARIGRVLQAYDLKEAEDRFAPKYSLNLDTNLDSAYRPGSGAGRGERDSTTRMGVSPGVNLNLPTGGSVNIAPNWNVSRSGDWDDSSAITITLSQPLLKGGGLRIGRAPVVAARLAEERNLLGFRTAVMDAVTQVIKAYRAVTKAELQHDIAVRALERARATLRVNQLMIQTGRMARQDITQTEADIAGRELEVVKRQTALDDARRQLNVLLDLDSGTRIKPIEPLTVQPVRTEIERSQAAARENHTAYLDAQLGVRAAEIEAMVAENNSLWDLSLQAKAEFSGEGDSPGNALGDLPSNRDEGNYSLGLKLTVPLGDTQSNAAERARLSARLALRRARYGLQRTAREMDIAVRDAVHAVEAGYRGMTLARQASKLAEKKLEIEQGKLKLGLSSTYQIANFQTDLVNAQVSELEAKINYLNALTDLDRITGTVLDTWRIDVNEEPR